MKSTSTCVQCNIEFYIKDKSKANKFCSPECYKIHRRCNAHPKTNSSPKKIANCVICHNEFTQSTKRSKTCSLKCANALIVNTKGTIRYCDMCQNSYKTLNKTSRFCSRQCYWDYRNSNPNEIIQSNQITTQKIIKQCIHCGSPYSVWNYRASTATFCSYKCHQMYNNTTSTCPTCKTKFTYATHTNKKYCSVVCAVKGCDKRKSRFALATKNCLDTLHISYKSEEPIKTINRLYTVDFIINGNIILECYGDYWHCNPQRYAKEYYHKQIRKTAGEIWDYDSKRLKTLSDLGYITIFIWESEWRKNKNFIQTITNKLQGLIK